MNKPFEQPKWLMNDPRWITKNYLIIVPKEKINSEDKVEK